MKTLFLLTFYIAALLFFMLFLNSCAKCDKDVVKLENINIYIPYSGADTLRFLHNNTDTQLFVGLGMERFITEALRPDECSIPYECYRVHFGNTISGENITVEYGYRNDVGHQTYNFEYKGKSLPYGYVLLPIEGGLNNKLTVNAQEYYHVTYHANTKDSAMYFAFCNPRKNNQELLIKIKFPGDTLTLVK